MSSRLARIRAALVAIGVVLAVAIVFTLLIAVLGGSVGYVWGTLFGGSGGGPSGPIVEFETMHDGDELTIEHAGGDTLDPGDVVIRVADEERGTWADYGGSSTVAEGSTITVDGVDSGDRVRLIWNGADDPFVLEDTTA